MNEDNQNKKKDHRISRGFSLIYLLFVAAFAWCIFNIIKIQYIEAETWKEIGSVIKNSAQPRVIEPTRGNIYSLNLYGEKEVLAASMKMYRIYFNGAQLHVIEKDRREKEAKNSKLAKFNRTDSVSQLATRLAEFFQDKPASEYRRLINESYKTKKRVLLISRNVDYIERKEIIKFPLFNTGGGKYNDCLISEPVNKRVHPYGNLALRTIGDVFSNKNVQGSKADGRFGIEMQFDSLLRGVEGEGFPIKISRGKTIYEEIKKPIAGADITLTLNMDMQDIVHTCLLNQAQRLGIERGCAILMEVETGEIKAIDNLYYSSKGYFEGGNMAIADLNPPGSTFKAISMLVALEDGVITPDTIVDSYNKRYPQVPDHAPNPAWASITASDVFVYSSNVGTANMIAPAYERSPMEFVRAIKRTGFCEPFDIQLPGASIPHIGPIDFWKVQDTINRTDLPSLTFGYQAGIPPIYMLRFYNAIANDGKMVNPFLVKEIDNNGEKTHFKTTVANSAIASKKSVRQMQEMLRNVVEQKGGTGYYYRSDKVSFAGKTGTAYFKVSGAMTDQVSFCGYFPADKPKYSCIVVMQRRGMWGSQSCEVFRNIAERVIALSTVRHKGDLQDSLRYYPSVKTSQKRELKPLLSSLDFKTSFTDYDWYSISVDSVGLQSEPLQLIENLVPNVVGMGAKDAVYLLERSGLRVQLRGRGTVRRQSLPVGVRISKGQTIILELF